MPWYQNFKIYVNQEGYVLNCKIIMHALVKLNDIMMGKHEYLAQDIV